MEERREISRVEYKTNGVVVICDTQEKIYVDVKDISPLGMGICVPEGHEGLLGKQVIVVAETLIMYAEVSREEKQEDGSTFCVTCSVPSYMPNPISRRRSSVRIGVPLPSRKISAVSCARCKGEQ